MNKKQEPIHTWLIMLKSLQAVSKYILPSILEEGIGDSDFRVLEVLFHKGPMPVNTIGPKVNLNPGSVSVAVDRLYKKGLVSRVQSTRDRRVRTVSITDKGRKFFCPIFQRHTALIRRAFEQTTAAERQQLEALLKKIGMHAQSLAEGEAVSE